MIVHTQMIGVLTDSDMWKPASQIAKEVSS